MIRARTGEAAMSFDFFYQSCQFDTGAFEKKKPFTGMHSVSECIRCQFSFIGKTELTTVSPATGFPHGLVGIE
jgi:hypothetical protein